MTRTDSASNLLEAAIGIARSTIDNESDVQRQQEQLDDLAAQIPDLAPHLPTLHSRLLSDDPHPEVLHFHRARYLAHTVLPHPCPHPLFQLAAELLALPITGAIRAARVMLDVFATPSRPTRLRAVLRATASPRRNALALARFVASILALSSTTYLHRTRPPTLAITLLRGPPGTAVHFDRLRARLVIRLVALSTHHLGWPQAYFGSVHAAHIYYTTADPYFPKRIVAEEVSEVFAKNVANCVLSRAFAQDVGNVLKETVDCDIATVRVLLISRASWCHTGPGIYLTDIRHFSGHIRTFIDRYGVKFLEICIDNFSDWDHDMLPQALLHGVSVSLLVFRFDSLQGLAKYISKSKAITDRFPGLTMDVERIMYVDTSTKAALSDVRAAVQDIVVERRLLQPRGEKDILFEAVDGAAVARKLSARAREKKSILNSELSGPCREHMQRVVHVLNREISEAEARAESEEVVRFMLRLKSTIHTKVVVRRNPNLISVSRGDPTGFSMTSTDLTNLLRDSEYRDIRDVTEKKPFTIDARIQLGKAGNELHSVGRFAHKWGVISRLAKMVTEERKLLLTAADERKTVLQRGRQSFVTAVRVTILGGGMTEFLYAKMIRSCVEAVRADKGQPEQMAVRTLLRLVPGLGAAAHAVRQA